MKNKLGAAAGLALLLIIAVEIFGPPIEQPNVNQAAERENPSATRLGAMSDVRGRSVGYTRGVWTDSPISKGAIHLVCVAEYDQKIFVLDGQPYAATGFTSTFSKRWGVTLEVNSEAKPIMVYDGAIGEMNSHIDAICKGG